MKKGIALLFLMMFASLFADEVHLPDGEGREEFSGFVFWEYDENDSYDVITAKTYKDLLAEKPSSVFLPFDDCLKFDYGTLEFYYADEEIMNEEIQLKDYEDGNEFFSIVIDGAIAMKGLNRVGYFGARRLREDVKNRVYICWIGLDVKRFKLTTDYTSAFNMCLDQKKDLDLICTKSINDFF